MICPKTMKNCWDDLCRGSGCAAFHGDEPSLTICQGCDEYIPFDGSYHDMFRCKCGPGEEWDQDESDRDYESDKKGASMTDADRITAMESELATYKDTTPATFAEVEDVIMENVSTAKIHRNQSDGSFTVTNCRVVIRTRADLAAVRRVVG